MFPGVVSGVLRSNPVMLLPLVVGCLLLMFICCCLLLDTCSRGAHLQTLHLSFKVLDKAYRGNSVAGLRCRVVLHSCDARAFP